MKEKDIRKLIQFVEEGAVSRAQDDHDGDWTQRLIVSVLPNGDTVIAIPSGQPLRFRNEIGGTRSPATHLALLVLAEAIKLDQASYPEPT